MNQRTERRSRLSKIEPSTAARYLPAATATLDLVVLATVTIVATLGRERMPVLAGLNASDVLLSPSVALMILLGWLLALTLFRSYKIDVKSTGTEEYRRVLHASTAAAGAIGVGCFLAKEELSRGFFVLLFGLGVPALLAGRFFLRRALATARRDGALRQSVVVVGSVSHIDEIVGVLRRESWLGYDVVGALAPRDHAAVETATGVPVIGDAEDAARLVSEAGVDVVVFAGGGLESAGELRRVVWDLEHEDVSVVIAPSLSDISAARVQVRPVGGLPLMHIESPRWVHAARSSKRVFDVVGALGVLVAVLPVLVVAAAWVKLHDGGPVLFRQSRTGRNGKEFGCLKLRTMVVDAEAHLERLKKERGLSDEMLFKLKDDPRCTKPGLFLRRFSLDELPQLVNVLRGEMSLVGPRPPLPKEVASYEAHVLRRLHVRPGLTGLWQVSGRSDLAWDDTVRLDLYYVDNWSMLQDLAILVRTVKAVLGKDGAY